MMRTRTRDTKKTVHGRPYETASAAGAPEPVLEPSEEEIRRRAYEIWEEDGRPDARDGEHWDRAREELQRQVDDRGRVGTTAGARKIAAAPEADE